MSQASSQAWAFYREVAKKGVVWTIKDTGGFPAPKTRTGQRAQPFWSSKSRVERIIATVPAYSMVVECEWGPHSLKNCGLPNAGAMQGQVKALTKALRAKRQ